MTATVPFATSLSALAAQLKPADVAMWTPDEFLTVAARLGRKHGPMLLQYVGDRLPPATLTAAVPAVWSMVEYPDEAMGHDQWRHYWHRAGFTRDGARASRPIEALQLYRGAVKLPAYRRRDWSWTSDRAVAERFATGGLGGRPAGEVWTALVPPQHLLGFIDTRAESEWVVDTRGLEILEVTT